MVIIVSHKLGMGAQAVREPARGLHHSLGLSRDFPQTRLSCDRLLTKEGMGDTHQAEGTACANSGLKCGWRERVAGDEPERLVGAGCAQQQ